MPGGWGGWAGTVAWVLLTRSKDVATRGGHFFYTRLHTPFARVPTPRLPLLPTLLQECGGLLPWLGWKEFFFSTATPGNGGPLLQPRGQTSVFYRVPPPPTAEQQVQAQQAQQAEQQAAGAAQQPAVQQQRQQQQ